MWDESTIILNAESQKQLNKQHDDLHRESLKLLFIKKLLLENKELAKKNEEIAIALKVYRSREFLGFESDNLLHLNEYCNSVNLSYNAQKDLQNMVWQAMQTKFNEISPLMKKLQLNFPHLLHQKENLDSPTALIDTESAELLSLDMQRRKCLQKLAEIHNRKLKSLKVAAEIKLNPRVTEKLEMLHLDLCIDQVKANLFRDYMINEFVNNSEHTTKAIKFVEKHIDELINKDDETERVDKTRILLG